MGATPSDTEIDTDNIVYENVYTIEYDIQESPFREPRRDK